MKFLLQHLSDKKFIYKILILGLLLRILFIVIGGKIYYGTSSFFIQGDTNPWFQAFINLWEHGTFTTVLRNESGKFFRPPGYSFLFGIFYLLSFKNILLASGLLVAAQVIMDIVSIFLIYKIAENLIWNSSEEKKLIFMNGCSLLYAIYPFVIVWSPVLYAETSSIFFILLSFYFFLKPVSHKNVFLSGFFGGIAALLRLQCILWIPCLVLTYLISKELNLKKKIRFIFLLGFGVLLTYGLWPGRNYFLQHRVLFSEENGNIGSFWSKDFLAFLHFVYAVRTDHVPVFNQIIFNKKVEWPRQAYLDSSDSLLLDSVVSLCRKCGTGFSYWMVSNNVQKKPVLPSENCDSVIDKIFTSLYLKQKSQNAFNYWVMVPLGNLYKCVFKFSLYGDKSKFVKFFSSSLFLFRTLLIVLGLLGIYLSMKYKFLDPRFCILIASFALANYFYLSFFYRNMEMRYLLQSDVLLLIPAAYFFVWIFSKSKNESLTKS
jgi:hypothetical protein